ncbi:Uncharacterized protein DAT39_010189 [Clarias magur]|uniref:Uncharacterized protein n=1 Tax=Clarias magur TaxID=1594786 RepID=A0A8J4X0A0_CLAMG|nr:Uncharacterized protein DAT39_010189 [Clarias magur]
MNHFHIPKHTSIFHTQFQSPLTGKQFCLFLSDLTPPVADKEGQESPKPCVIQDSRRSRRHGAHFLPGDI